VARKTRWQLLAGLAALTAGLFIGIGSASADPRPPEVEVEGRNGLCFACHDEELLVEEDGQEARTVDSVRASGFDASAHREVTCVECHGSQSVLPHKNREELAALGRTAAASCRDCHEKAYDGFMGGHHGTMIKLRDAWGPECSECHGSPHYLPLVAQWSKEDRAAACAECHDGATTTFLDAAPGHTEAHAGFFSTPYFAGLFLMVLTVITLAFGIIHVELEMLRWLAERFTGKRGARTASDGDTG
jgi:hypothetical protein